MNPVYDRWDLYGRYEKGDTRLKPRAEWTVVPDMRETVVARRMFAEVQQFTE